MRIRRGLGAAFALVLACAAVPALARTWQVDAARSTVTFTGTCQNAEYTGRFNRFTASIAYDPNDLARAKFDVSVEIASLDMQDSGHDHAALGAAFLDTARFPRAYLTTTTFLGTATGRVIAEGELALRGVIKPVLLDVTFAPHGDTATLDVTARLRRLDFGIGTGQWSGPSRIGNAVTMHGHLFLRAAR